MRVLLVDDNPEFLKAAERILVTVPRLEVVGCARSGEEALAQIRVRQPELVLLDWSLPGLNGLEAARLIRDLPNPPRVLIHSLQDYPEYRRAAREAGAEGFIPKSEFRQKIPAFIEYLTAQEELEKPQRPDPTGREGRERLVRPPEEPAAGGITTGNSPPGSSDRPPAARSRSELLARLGEGLIDLKLSCTRIRPLLERGQETPWGEGNQALKPVFRGLEKALAAVEEVYREVLQVPDPGPPEPMRRTGDYYLLFEINQGIYGLPAHRVLCVEKPAPLIRLPREYKPLVGLADIDNRRVPIIDLRLWEGLEKTPCGEAGRLILVETGKSAAGLLVDVVRDLTTSVGSNGFPLRPNPEVGRKPFLDRLVQIKDRFIYVWDVDKIMDYLNLTDAAEVRPQGERANRESDMRVSTDRKAVKSRRTKEHLWKIPGFLSRMILRNGWPPSCIGPESWFGKPLPCRGLSPIGWGKRISPAMEKSGNRALR